MKTRRKLITVVTLCMVALIFCFPGTVLAGGSPNSSAETDPTICPNKDTPLNEPCPYEKIVGPVTKADLIAVFNGEGVEVILFVNGVWYFTELILKPTLEVFNGTTAEDITSWKLPDVIADQLGVDLGATGRVVIAGAKDVTNFVNEIRMNASYPNDEFKHIISCEVQISFIVPRSK